MLTKLIVEVVEVVERYTLRLPFSFMINRILNLIFFGILPKYKISQLTTMEHYLSDTIYIQDNKTYSNCKQVKRHNWHQLLAELGWSKLHKQWITRLNKVHNPYPNNSLFGCLECGDDGDCLFHCIASSLNSTQQDYYEASDIRRLVAESITQEQYDQIISCYRSMKDLDDFEESWDPYTIDSLEEFKQQVMTSGNVYWGDYLLIQLLIQTLTINLFILTQNEFTDTYEPYPLMTIYDKDKPTIILLHENGAHFQLIGHFQDIMKTHFTHQDLPLEIKGLFDV